MDRETAKRGISPKLAPVNPYTLEIFDEVKIYPCGFRIVAVKNNVIYETPPNITFLTQQEAINYIIFRYRFRERIRRQSNYFST